MKLGCLYIFIVMKTGFVLVTLGLASLALMGLFTDSSNQFEHQFTSYMTQFDKSYETENEYNFRREIFNKNLEIINAHNAKGFSSKLGVNEFTDWTDEEYKSMLGLRRQPLRSSQTLKTIKAKGEPELVSIDHRNEGLVTDVKNQGACGSCWAFSTVASIEGAYAKEHGELKSFSEAHLAECDKFSGGCMGGWMINGLLFFTQRGPITDEEYPYSLPLGTCREAELESNYESLPYAFRVEDDEDSLYEALTHNVVSVSIRAENDKFRHYQSGILDEEDDCGTEIDHGVTLVGYEADGDYWIVKNSWGGSWGNEGYVHIKRRGGKGICGINQDSAQAVFHQEDY
ncbi:unnamed protein product [Moneuplotes crassus]|uniref:Uncharacterized protein n=1 Tax=Euplotes crassus TaxID=5936 RepID=A0AAD2CXT6_EUPCR|nr:unnamed protein product [Moneuplotes crassus]